MTAKEALQVLIDNLEYPCDKEYDIVWNALNRLEELEKVLKIIKEKRVDAGFIWAGSFRGYNKFTFDVSRYLTETEFNLLKEYLE